MKKSLHLLLAALLVTVGACNDDPLFEIPPEAPTTVGAAVQGTSANITWTPGAGATSQEVRMSPVVPVPASAGTALLVEDDQVQTFADNTTSSALFENLTSGTTYSTTVTAINGSSRTTSDPIIVQITAEPSNAPILTAFEQVVEPPSLLVEWTPTDPASENYRVVLTSDDGEDPISDIFPSAATSASFSTDLYPTIMAGVTYTAQVFSVNGTEEVGSNTLTLTVGAVPPTVTIVAPADSSEFTQGDTDITFTGNAVDQFGVEVPPADLEWTSDIDGVLGIGNVLDVSPDSLTAGNHVITLTAIDSESLEGTAEINIVINVALASPSFANDIQPYFVDSGCTGCHGATVQQGTVRLDSYTEITTGSNGAGAPLIVAGDAADTTAILIPTLEAVGHPGNGPDDQGFVDTYLAPWIDDGAQEN